MTTTPKPETAAKKDVTKLQRAIVDGLEDVKAQDIQVFNTEHLSPLFERVIVASGTSNRQTKALAASVRDAVKEAGFDKPRMEGEENGEWIIVDCGAAVAHIMQPAIRQYYRLEEIWGDKPVKLGAAKRKSTTEGQEAAAPKSKSKHLAANQEQEDAKPVRERKPAAKKSADAKPAAKKPAAKKIPTGATVKVAVSKTAAADAKAAKAAKAAAAPKRATKAAAEGDAPAKKVIRRIKKTEE
jgi:ribosome-associated protein